MRRPWILVSNDHPAGAQELMLEGLIVMVQLVRAHLQCAEIRGFAFQGRRALRLPLATFCRAFGASSRFHRSGGSIRFHLSRLNPSRIPGPVLSISSAPSCSTSNAFDLCRSKRPRGLSPAQASSKKRGALDGLTPQCRSKQLIELLAPFRLSLSDVRWS